MSFVLFRIRIREIVFIFLSVLFFHFRFLSKFFFFCLERILWRSPCLYLVPFQISPQTDHKLKSCYFGWFFDRFSVKKCFFPFSYCQCLIPPLSHKNSFNRLYIHFRSLFDLRFLWKFLNNRLESFFSSFLAFNLVQTKFQPKPIRNKIRRPFCQKHVPKCRISFESSKIREKKGKKSRPISFFPTFLPRKASASKHS